MSVSSADVAIVIPVYAQHPRDIDWLAKCIESCKSQVGEVFVWDDGSPLDTYPMVRSLGVSYGRDAHVGKSFARNSAVLSIERDIFLPVDADDWLEENAVEVLLEHWDGRPIYSDIYRVEGGARNPVNMLDFSCETICPRDENINPKCISTVNVLHTADQWDFSGGWNEELNLYEDWEYNSRLFSIFGGKRVRAYLVNYRHHRWQSTSRVNSAVSWNAKIAVFDSIRSQLERNDKSMACCGKKRRADSSTNTVSPTTPTTDPSPAIMKASQSVDMSVTVPNLASLGDPGPGKVWALYVGGRGMGPHKKRGMSNRRKIYNRVQYGGRYAVFAEDAVTKSQFEKGARNCGFVRIEEIKPATSAPPPPKPTPSTSSSEGVRAPVRTVDRSPVSVGELKESKGRVETYSVRELNSIKGELETDVLLTYVEQEKSSPNPRVTVLKILDRELEKRLSEEV